MSPLGPMPVGIVNVAFGTSIETNANAGGRTSTPWLVDACPNCAELRRWRKLGKPGVRGDLMDWAAIRKGSSKSAATVIANQRILLGWVMAILLKPSLPYKS